MFVLRTSTSTVGPLLRTIRRVHTQIHPNGPLELDNSFRELLRDADMSLAKHRGSIGKPPPIELESWPVPTESIQSADGEHIENDDDHDQLSARWKRKSPQARFGSTGLASGALPLELQRSIDSLIQGLISLLFFHALLIKSGLQSRTRSNSGQTPNVFSSNLWQVVRTTNTAHTGPRILPSTPAHATNASLPLEMGSHSLPYQSHLISLPLRRYLLNYAFDSAKSGNLIPLSTLVAR